MKEAGTGTTQEDGSKWKITMGIAVTDLSGLGTEIIQHAADYVINTEFELRRTRNSSRTRTQRRHISHFGFYARCEASVEDHDIRRPNLRVTTCLE